MDRPADLEEVRASYDQVADTCVDLMTGRLEDQPWSRAGLDAFAQDVAGLGGVLGWWSLFNLPRTVLPQVLADFARVCGGRGSREGSCARALIVS